MHPYTIDVDTIRCGPRGDPTFRWRPQGCPYNNVVDESTNRILKAKLVHREAFGTTRELRAKLSDYVHWYNNFRSTRRWATCLRSSSGKRGRPSRNRPNRCCQSRSRNRSPWEQSRLLSSAM